MKMPNADLLAAILAAKEQGIRAILAFAMAYLRGRYNGGAFTKTVIDLADVRHYRPDSFNEAQPRLRRTCKVAISLI